MGTVQLLCEGLDLPFLSCVVLCSAPSAGPALQQIIGRVQRPFEGKARCVVVDVVDAGVFRGRAYGRRRQYRDLGYTVEHLTL